MNNGTGHSDDNRFQSDLYGDDELMPFDARDYSGRRAMRLLVITVLLLIVAAFLAFRIYSDGFRDRAEPPRIAANDQPYKLEPEDPGGEVTPNQDKSVYDVMNGTENTETVTALPPPEDPIDLPRSATIIVEDNSAKTPKPQPKPADTKPPVTKPAVNRTPAASRPAPTAQGSDHVVQVASVRSREDAEALWYELKAKFATDLPNGSYADVRRVDLNERGIYYRLRIAGLSDKTAANQLCQRFESRQQACFVTRK